MNGYVYIWIDKLNNKKYIGARKGDYETDNYICSSKPMLAEYNKRPDDFKREIVFEGTLEEVSAVEEEIQKIHFEKSANLYNKKVFKYLGHITRKELSEIEQIHAEWDKVKKEIKCEGKKNASKKKAVTQSYIENTNIFYCDDPKYNIFSKK